MLSIKSELELELSLDLIYPCCQAKCQNSFGQVCHDISFFVEIKETDECNESNEPEFWDDFTIHLSDVSIV